MTFSVKTSGATSLPYDIDFPLGYYKDEEAATKRIVELFSQTQTQTRTT
jgi:hypothetical protein